MYGAHVNHPLPSRNDRQLIRSQTNSETKMSHSNELCKLTVAVCELMCICVADEDMHATVELNDDKQKTQIQIKKN